jgi:hypothetical protein
VASVIDLLAELPLHRFHRGELAHVYPCLADQHGRFPALAELAKSSLVP